MTRQIAVKTQDSKLIANLCQSCSRACPRLRQPCKAPPAVHQMSNAHHMPASRPLSNCDCNGCEHQTIRFVRPSPGGGPRPPYSCARCCRLCALALLLATRLSSPRRRRPASVSNCCGRPQMPTADWALRSSVLNKVVARNVCYLFISLSCGHGLPI